MPCPCRAAKGFILCLSHFIYTVRPCLIHACHAMSRPCRYESNFSRPRYSTAWAHHGMWELISAVDRRPVGELPASGFFRLPRGVPRRLLSEAYQSKMQVASVKPNVCHGRGKAYYFGARTWVRSPPSLDLPYPPASIIVNLYSSLQCVCVCVCVCNNCFKFSGFEKLILKYMKKFACHLSDA